MVQLQQQHSLLAPGSGGGTSTKKRQSIPLGPSHAAVQLGSSIVVGPRRRGSSNLRRLPREQLDSLVPAAAPNPAPVPTAAVVYAVLTLTT
jgi:hypothetical protein